MTEHIDRDALRKLADAATPGPWEQVNDHREARVIAPGGEHWLWIADIGSAESPEARRDAAFIAAARTAVPALLDALEQAEARIKAVRDVLDQNVIVGQFSKRDLIYVEHIRRALDG